MNCKIKPKKYAPRHTMSIACQESLKIRLRKYAKKVKTSASKLAVQAIEKFLKSVE